MEIEKLGWTLVVLLIFAAVAGIVEGYQTRRIDGVEASFLSIALAVTLLFGGLLWAAYAAEASGADLTLRYLFGRA